MAAARRFATSRLAEEDDELRERVELMVSELAANCVVHAATSFEVSVSRRGGQVEVEVTDGNEAEPAVHWPDPRQPRGRGLQIVSALADRWGVRPSPDGQPGKTVWFTLARRPSSAPPARRAFP